MTSQTPIDAAISALQSIDWFHPTLLISAASIIFNPTAWNIIARNEYRNKTMARMMGSPKRGCYLLAFLIFSFGILRDYLFTVAMDHQPTSRILQSPQITFYAGICIAVGNILVLSSMWKLGITGTYLGDYFGILMEKRVTGFPFNVVENPMYFGSTLCFLGASLWRGCPAGLVLTGVVYVVYAVAVEIFEGPFTASIYQKRDEQRKALKKGAGKKLE
ncbi:methylene-fatty-acyl-phospholipid synthase-like protein [Phlyctochytrium arcticum]|nr:methylene-fatty-acyl-phospholipid synthase-like protein [Phlyctochytrium arcticum]